MFKRRNIEWCVCGMCVVCVECGVCGVCLGGVCVCVWYVVFLIWFIACSITVVILQAIHN
jgi:hypothetical protein